MRHSRTLIALAFLSVLAAAMPLLGARPPATKGRITRGKVLPEVVAARDAESKAPPPMPATGFAPQSRRGFTAGDQWEPSIAADRFGTVYVLYPQYFGVPGCPSCPSPTMILQISRDRGATWEAPGLIGDPGSGQVDAQVAVDPVDGRTVYASWLQNNKSDIAVARSDDFGETWSVVVADSTQAGTDKPIIAVRGPDRTYVGPDNGLLPVAPDKLGTVSERTHTPIPAILLCLAGGITFVGMLAFTTFFQLVIFIEVAVLAWAIVLLAGVFFPYRRPDIYNKSPLANLKIAGLPIMSVACALGAAAAFFYFFNLFFDDFAAGHARHSMSVLIGWFVGSFVIYWIMWFIRRRQGVNVDLAFKEIPIE